MTPTPDPDPNVTASPLTRRGLIKQVTAVGTAALATGLVLTQGEAAAAGTAAHHTPAEHSGSGQGRPFEPLVVRLLDPRTGELEFFQGHRHYQLHDPKLAAELLRANR